jgi:bifunctional DNA-binding transcriptional regulator/antitoxin component of YhaV-PrlF toxin-antitoxin module
VFAREEIFMAALKLRKTAEGIDATFPNEVLARMNVGDGDLLHVVDTPEGILLTPVHSEVAEELEVARKVMRENAVVLRALAK